MFYKANVYFRFLNWQADAIHQADPSALVSVGVWNPIDNTDAFGLNDLFKDECLTAAGGKSRVSPLGPFTPISVLPWITFFLKQKVLPTIHGQ